MATKKPEELNIPKQPAAAADLWYEVMQQRLELNRQVKLLEEKEAKIKAHLLAVLPANDATGVAGKLVRVSLVPKQRVNVTDWAQVYAYIAANYKKNSGVFGLLQRRVGEDAVKEIWAAGKTVPGLEAFPYMSLSYSAIK